jgi:hypothetical protein
MKTFKLEPVYPEPASVPAFDLVGWVIRYRDKQCVVVAHESRVVRLYEHPSMGDFSTATTELPVPRADIIGRQTEDGIDREARPVGVSGWIRVGAVDPFHYIDWGNGSFSRAIDLRHDASQTVLRSSVYRLVECDDPGAELRLWQTLAMAMMVRESGSDDDWKRARRLAGADVVEAARESHIHGLIDDIEALKGGA